MNKNKTTKDYGIFYYEIFALQKQKESLIWELRETTEETERKNLIDKIKEKAKERKELMQSCKWFLEPYWKKRGEI